MNLQTAPTIPRTLPLYALRAGDVLLSRGIGDLSDLICSVDGGRYSHAGLWDGEQVVEAVRGGIHANPLHQGVQAVRYIDVYRFHRDGDWLGAPTWPADPVVVRAHAFVGGEFGHADLLLAALVVALGRETSVPAMKLALEKLGADARRYITSKLFEGSDSTAEPRSSSQVVAAAYSLANAMPHQSYALEIRARRCETDEGLRSRAHSTAMEADYVALSLAWRARLRAGAPALARAIDAAAGQGRSLRTFDRRLPLLCVTPRDLETSPSLECIGRLPQFTRRD